MRGGRKLLLSFCANLELVWRNSAVLFSGFYDHSGLAHRDISTEMRIEVFYSALT